MATLLRTPETQHRIHFQDCDMLGHLNNARYLDYFLNAREDQVAEHYTLNMGELAREQQAAWVITKHQLSYLKPARQGILVRILTQIIHFDNSNLVVEMQMPAGSRVAICVADVSDMAAVERIIAVAVEEFGGCDSWGQQCRDRHLRHAGTGSGG